MAEDIGALVARVVADQEGFKSDMAKLAQTVESTTARMNANLSRISKASDVVSGSFRLMTRAAGVFGVALSARALVQFTTQSINAAAELQNLSVRLNASVESLSELQYVAKLADVDFQSFTNSLQIMTRNFGEASKGSKGMQDTFRQLGIDFRLLSGLPVDQQLETVAEALNRVGDESLKAALGQEVFGKGWGQVSQALDGGAAAVRRARAEARELGVTTADTAKAASEFNDQIDKLKTSFTPLVNAILDRAIPTLQKFAEAARKALNPTAEEEQADGMARALQRQQETILGAKKAYDDYANAVVENFSAYQGRTLPDYIQQRLVTLSNAIKTAEADLKSLEMAAQSVPGSSVAAPMVPGLVAPGSPQTSTLSQQYPGLQMIGAEGLGGKPAEGANEAFRENEEALTAIVKEQWDARLQAATDATAGMLEVAKHHAEQEVNYRQMVTNSAVGLLSALGSKHRGAAIAALAIQKALAVKEILIQSQVAAMRALAELGPVAGGPVAAGILLKGKISAALVAATGLVEAAQLSSGGVQSTLGTSANPIATRDTSSSAAAAGVPGKQSVVQLHFHGDVNGWDSYIERKVIASIRDAVDGRDVVIFGRNSRQAALLAGA